jgi:hypothetical protein
MLENLANYKVGKGAKACLETITYTLETLKLATAGVFVTMSLRVKE